VCNSEEREDGEQSLSSLFDNDEEELEKLGDTYRGGIEDRF
jgi:hypothetical protein